MEIYCEGTARIRHKDTHVVYEIESDELNWDGVGGEERSMGTELHYEAVVDHPQLGELAWGLWEYPIGTQNYGGVEIGGHDLIEDFDYGLRHEVPVDEWMDHDAPSDPFSIFLNSYHQTSKLLTHHGGGDGSDLINRLVFSHQVTALEAYLGDTLMNAVAADASATQRLVEADEDLSKSKFTLAEISKDPGLVTRRVREHLRGILYHNLAKVDVLYNIALGIRILNLTPNKAELFKAIKLRHDCVHRNGFDKDGNELTDLTREVVRDIASLIRTFVESIEAAVHQRPSTRSGGSA